jgi:hypothetical protein
MTLHKHFKRLAAPIALSLLTACAVAPPKTPEQIVGERAAARWQSLMQGKFEDSYKMHEPEFRKNNTFEQYDASTGKSLPWVGAELFRVKCELEKCDARFSVSVPSPIPNRFSGNITTVVDEVWILVDGQWWLQPRSAPSRAPVAATE